MIDYKMIGARIRAIRNARKMTQEQLAEAVGVGVTHISHIETGNSIPSLQVVINMVIGLSKRGGSTPGNMMCMICKSYLMKQRSSV